MLTAARARYLTNATGIIRRFVDFALDAFADCRSDSSSHLWTKHFADTGFDERKNEFEEVAAEILLSRTVDAFQYYLADIIGWALWRRPEVADLLKKAEQRAVEDGVDLDDATMEVARSHAEQLSYRGFSAMVSFIEATFGVALLVGLDTKTKLRRIIAVRNMIAHNRSRKNARFCKDTGEPVANVGQIVRPSLSDAHAAVMELGTFVELIDSTLHRELLDYRG